MKIGFDAKRAFFNHRGLGNYSRDTIRIISSYNINNEIYLFTPSTDNIIKFNYSDNCRVVNPDSAFDRSFSSLWRTTRMCKDIKRLNLDVFHGLSHELPFGIEKTHIKSVVTIHDLIFLKFPHLFPFFDRKMYTFKYHHSCEIADKIIAVSKQTKKDLIDLWNINKNKIKVVYQGCNPVFLRKKTKKQRDEVKKKYNLPSQFILNVGAIEERKNQKNIIQSLEIMKTDVPLIIVGRKSKYQSIIDKAIASNHLEDRVFILNNVDTEDLPAIYQMASLFVYPSLFEGFGIPVIEALFSGLPVITSTGSCLEESGGPGTCYISPENVEELAESMDKILNDNELKILMLNRNQEHLKQFLDENIAIKLLSIYNDVLKK